MPNNTPFFLTACALAATAGAYALARKYEEAEMSKARKKTPAKRRK